MSPRTSHLLQIQSLYWKNRSFLPTEVNEQHHEYYDYHDFDDAIEHSPSPSPGPGWTFDPSIGVVHAQNCSICRSYTKHVFIANHSNDTSFKKAQSAREKRVTAAFSDGVHAGRLLQQEHDNLQLSCYREERDKALHSVEKKTKVLDVTRKEVQALRDQILALQFTIDELLTRRNKDEVGDRVTESTVGSPKSDMSLMEPNSSVEVDDVDVLSTPPLSPADNYTILTHADTAAPDADASKEEEAPDSSFTTRTFTMECIVYDANALQPYKTATPSFKATAYPPYQPHPPKPFSAKHPTRSVPTRSIPTRAHKSSRSFTTLAELQAAMKAAHEGDNSSLTAVRDFKASAYGKPRHRQTKLHRYAMKHWHEPPTSYASASSVHTTLDGDTFSTEIYVDASQWGIGFMMNGLWFAWKFADSIAATLSGTQIDSNWAEMIAVEVGLWTVIHWVCSVIQKERGDLKSLEILVRSDNTGVVKAVEKRHTNHSLQQDTLRRILDMVSEHDVELTMKWIPSTDNLADQTSRGVPGRMADMLPFIPPLPFCLSDILSPISSNN